MVNLACGMMSLFPFEHEYTTVMCYDASSNLFWPLALHIIPVSERVKKRLSL